MIKLSNTLTINVFLAVYREHVTTMRLECDRLPWVSEAGASSAGALKVIVDEGISHPANEMEALVSAISVMIAKMQQHFEQEYSIFCSLHLHFVLEEQAENAIDDLRQRLQITDEYALNDLISRTSAPFSHECKPLDHVFQENGGRVSPENFELHSDVLLLSPGKSLHFEIHHQEPVRCTEVFLKVGDTEVLRYKSPWRMEANAVTPIQLPGIPAAMLRLFLQSEVPELKVYLILDGASDAICLNGSLPYAPVTLHASPVSLFLDVGSSQTKFLVVAHRTASDQTDIDQAALSSELKELLISACNGDHECITLDPPEPTPDFREKFDLPFTSKERLDASSNAALVAHFSDSIARLAKHYYLHEKKLIANVFWAFPNTKKDERNFAQMTLQINEALGGAILGKAEIKAEADCLRAAFSRPLRALSLSASSAEEKKRDLERQQEEENRRDAEQAKAYADYEKSFFLVRWAKKILFLAPDPASNSPNNTPIPALEPWQYEFLKLNCDENLSQFVAFDAGGYSLDVFGSFADESNGDLSISFDAGSSRINDFIKENLKSLNPSETEQNLRDRADEIKLTVCRDIANQQRHAFYLNCENATEQIYGIYLDEVIDQLPFDPQQKGFPIILTGGGAQNQFLVELLEQKLRAKGFATIPITAATLYGTLRQAGMEHSNEVKLFLCMASAFHPEWEQPYVASRTDILGGLAQLAITEM